MTRFIIIFFIAVLAPAVFAVQFKTVGVMTFSNLTGSDQHEWVAEAFSNSVSEKLGQIVEFSVVDRESIYALKPVQQKYTGREIKKSEAKEIAELVGVDYLIFGSVQAAGILSNPRAPLRVHARIVDTVRGVVHRAVIVDGKLSDIYSLQYKLSREFLDIAKVQASVAELKAMQSVSTLSLEAYRLYNMGLIKKRHKNYAEAIPLFEQAMRKHPGILYADSHYQIGQTYLKMGRNEELLVRFSKDAARLSPVFFDLGTAYERSRRTQDAIDAYKMFLNYNDNKSVLWSHTVLDEKVQVVSTVSSPYFVYREKNQFTCIDSSNGLIKWKNKLPFNGGDKMTVTSTGFYVQDRDKSITRVDCKTGAVTNFDVAPPEDLSFDNENETMFRNADLLVSVSEKTVQVVDPKNNKSVWKLNVQGDEKIVGYNNETVCVTDGSRKIRGIKIQKNSRPSDAEGLLGLARSLKAEGRDSEVLDIYKYLNLHSQ